MRAFDVRNVSEAVAQVIPELLASGVPEDSRNGEVLVYPTPVCTSYQRPWERVLFSPTRDANPFFHLFESLWMLAGCNDVAFPAQFAKRIESYSDNGKIIFGAYGWRWREFFGYDQLKIIIAELKKNPNSRRCVLAMWNAFEEYSIEDPEVPLLSHSDLFIAMNGGKDVPCNTHAYFDVRGGNLNMTVCNRSNDIVWGAYGANAVHFSFLLEYMAEQIGVPVGVYNQVSNNLHAYTGVYSKEQLWAMSYEAAETNLYRKGKAKPMPLGSSISGWHEQLAEFIENPTFPTNRENFFSLVCEPMYAAFKLHKGGDTAAAIRTLERMPEGNDWKLGSLLWLRTRQERKEKKDAAA